MLFKDTLSRRVIKSDLAGISKTSGSIVGVGTNTTSAKKAWAAQIVAGVADGQIQIEIAGVVVLEALIRQNKQLDIILGDDSGNVDFLIRNQSGGCTVSFFIVASTGITVEATEQVFINNTVSTPVPTQQTMGGAVISATNPLPAQLSQGNAAISATNPIPAQLSQGNAALSAANPVPAQLSVAGVAASAANPVPTQLSQGNAVLSAANPVPAQLSQGNAALSAANPVPAQLSVGNAAATTANPVPVDVQSVVADNVNVGNVTAIGDAVAQSIRQRK